MAGGSVLSAIGQHKANKDARRAAAQGTTVSPWKPAQPYLEYGLKESRDLYEGRTPPPRMDYSQFESMVPGQRYLPGQGGQQGVASATGGGDAGAGSSGGGAPGGRPAGGFKGGIDRSIGFGGGIPGLNEDYDLYMSGGDFENMDSEFFRNYSDASRRAVERAYEPRRSALIDAFDPGMMGSTLLGQREAALEGEIGTAIGDSVIGGYGDFRGQNIGLIQNAMAQEQNRIATIEQTNAQRAAARTQASAQRYAADKQAAAQMAGVRAQNARTQQEAAQWAYQQRVYLAEAEQAQDMTQWNAPGAQLDDYLRRVGGVGGMGSHTVGPPPVGPNAMQTFGNAAMGFGTMGLGGAFGGGSRGAPTMMPNQNIYGDLNSTYGVGR